MTKRFLLYPALALIILFPCSSWAQRLDVLGASNKDKVTLENIPHEDVVDFFSGDNNTPESPSNRTVEEQAAAKQQSTSVKTEIREAAFQAALQSLLPLTPEEIRELLEHFDRTQESVELPVYPMPKPEMVVQNISLDPGTKPAVVRVAHGHVTTLNVLDSTGAPWPIEDITWAGNFDIVQSSSSNSGPVHFVRITPQSEFAYGNMSIKLLTLKTPITITVETSRDIVHYRFDAIIPEMGPLAEAPLIESSIKVSAGGPALSSILQGIIPAGAEKLKVEGVDSRTSAYLMGDDTFVRTPHSLLSPSWSNSVASADGTHVYTIQHTPVLLLSDKGKMVRAHLSAREDITDE